MTPDLPVLKGHTIPHFKGLVCTYMEAKPQKYNDYFSMFCTLLKRLFLEHNPQLEVDFVLFYIHISLDLY